jgi:hypothetical protein
MEKPKLLQQRQSREFFGHHSNALSLWKSSNIFKASSALHMNRPRILGQLCAISEVSGTILLTSSLKRLQKRNSSQSPPRRNSSFTHLSQSWSKKLPLATQLAHLKPCKHSKEFLPMRCPSSCALASTPTLGRAAQSTQNDA